MVTNCSTKRINYASKAITLHTKVAFFLVMIVCLVIAGCGADNGGEEDENGTIGTGLILRGTVNDSLLASGAVVEAYSSDGKREVIAINNDRSFSTDALFGEAPWLLRVQINSSRELYGIAHSDGTSNINAFSDVSLRRWFAQRSVNPEDVRNANARAGSLPSSLEYNESVVSIVELIGLVLTSYEVTSTDIISTHYITDDTGIDAFLRRNNVVIENGLVTFQTTDPQTNLQAVTLSPTALTSDFVDNGNGPSQPGSVRALSGGLDDIVLIWEPSVDDVGVIGYSVLRDGELIGTTPYPQFTDTMVDSDRRYTYIVVALDKAGNSSTPSLQATGTTSPPADSANAPPQPTSLRKISASDRLVRLSWNEPQNADVASYRLYRGVQTTPPTLLQEVSVTSALDSAVAIDQTYCYQVSALRVNGLESSRSEVLCIDATAEAAPIDPDVLPTSWNVPETDVSCTNTLTTTDIPVGLTTISDGCYTIPRTLEVRSGATLQVDEGVILKFGESAKLSITGTLTVLGTRDNPVVFTGFTNIPGSWGGVEFAGTSTANNLLRGAVIQYGGRGDVTGALSTRHNNNRFAMEETLIRFNEGAALSLNTGMLRISSFDGNLIYANDDVGNVIATAVHAFAGTTRYIDNVVNELTLHGLNVVGEDIVIPDVGIPIHWPGITIVNGSLTILPGADFDLAGRAVVDVDGPVVINGEPDRLITFRGRMDSSQGAWDGLRLHGNGNKVLNHVNINHAGSSGVDTGAVEIDCTDSSGVNVQIDNTDISDSASWGIYFKGGDCAIDIGSTVTYSNNGVGNTNIP